MHDSIFIADTGPHGKAKIKSIFKLAGAAAATVHVLELGRAALLRCDPLLLGPVLKELPVDGAPRRAAVMTED